MLDIKESTYEVYFWWAYLDITQSLKKDSVKWKINQEKL